jgi:hypothetical protein
MKLVQPSDDLNGNTAINKTINIRVITFFISEFDYKFFNWLNYFAKLTAAL